jgi:methionyl-tRNA formyltransferase
MNLRIIFMGTPDFAVPTLSDIVGQGHDVVAVYTREPKPAGRGMDLRKSPVHVAAERFGLRGLTPRTLRSEEAVEAFRAHGADLAVVVAYGMILPLPILQAPRLGCVNLHASLLPRWRGAAPIQRAIMAGDAETGVAVMRMEEGLDTGPIGMMERVAITPDMTAGELHDRLASIGADVMARALAALSRGALGFRPQPEDGVTYARKITNDDGHVDWTRPATTVHDQIRGLSPFPGAFTMVDLGRGPERLKLLRSTRVDATGPVGTALDDRLTIGCGEGAIAILEAQKSGARPMRTADLLRGTAIPAGTRFL